MIHDLFYNDCGRTIKVVLVLVTESELVSKLTVESRRYVVISLYVKGRLEKSETYDVLCYRRLSFVSLRPGNIKSVTDEKCAPYLFSQNESMGPSTINRERSNRNTTHA